MDYPIAVKLKGGGGFRCVDEGWMRYYSYEGVKDIVDLSSGGRVLFFDDPKEEHFYIVDGNEFLQVTEEYYRELLNLPVRSMCDKYRFISR